jgi:hypothetical protein
MRPWSWRWWFENRETGAITVAQFPNLPIWIALAGWLVGRFAGGAVATAAQVVTYLAIVWWAGDEIVRGVNPWRRVLGVGGLVYVAMRVLA